MDKGQNYCFQQASDDVYKLYIYDDVTEYGNFNWETWEYEDSETGAKYFREQLDAIPNTAVIELYINSNGGSVKEGIAILNQLRRKECKELVGYVDGVAHSIAFMIFQACDRRIMGEGTSALIHNMMMNVTGNATQLRKYADDLDTLMQGNRQILMSRAKNITEEELSEMMDKETFLNPEDCLEYGFCDEIEKPIEKQDNQNEATQQALQARITQLTQELTQQKSFREELIQFNEDAQKKPEQKTNKIQELFKKASKL